MVASGLLEQAPGIPGKGSPKIISTAVLRNWMINYVEGYFAPDNKLPSKREAYEASRSDPGAQGATRDRVHEMLSEVLEPVYKKHPEQSRSGPRPRLKELPSLRR